MFISTDKFKEAYDNIKLNALKVRATFRRVTVTCAHIWVVTGGGGVFSCEAQAPRHSLVLVINLQGDCTVIIFVSPDTDSICACWILTVRSHLNFALCSH